MKNEISMKSEINMKKEFKKAELTVICFGEDIIITSGNGPTHQEDAFDDP